MLPGQPEAQSQPGNPQGRATMTAVTLCFSLGGISYDACARHSLSVNLFSLWCLQSDNWRNEWIPGWENIHSKVARPGERCSLPAINLLALRMSCFV